jgi:hypothetical protein
MPTPTDAQLLSALLGDPSSPVEPSAAATLAAKLAPIFAAKLAPTPLAEAMASAIKRASEVDDEVGAVLDWWFLVNNPTDTDSPTGLAWTLPTTLGPELVAAMEALRDARPGTVRALWAPARRALGAQLPLLRRMLDYEFYGAAKLGGRERPVWDEIVAVVQPTIRLLEIGAPAQRVRLDERAVEGSMRGHRIEEGSDRWGVLLDRARMLTEAVDACVDLQALAEPWRPQATLPEPVAAVPGWLRERIGELAEALLAPVLDLSPRDSGAAVPAQRPEVGATAVDPGALEELVRRAAHHLDALAAAASERDRHRLLPLVAPLVEQQRASMPALREVAEREQRLQQRLKASRGKGASDDADEIELLVLDLDFAAAEEKLAIVEAQLKDRARVTRLERQIADAAKALEGVPRDAAPELFARLDSARSHLAAGRPDAAEAELAELEKARSEQERAQSAAEFQSLIDELSALLGPESAENTSLFDFRKRARDIGEGKADRAAALELLDSLRASLAAARSDRRRETEERLRRVREQLDDASEDFGRDRHDLELSLQRAEEALEDERFAEAHAAAVAAERLCQRARVNVWRRDKGEEVLLDHVLAYCNQEVDFDPLDVRRFFVALKTKPFVILAGLTGSGKSTLARLVAEALGAVAGEQFQRVAVRPDWIDQSEVLGFVNPTTRRFEPGWLADFVRRAERDPDRLHFALLDEMNLAPVEQYLAEVLSAMEEARAGGRDVRLQLYSRGAFPENREEWPPELRYPANLIIIGTVNIDETTRPLSDRVIDRANVIQLQLTPSLHHHRPRESRGRVNPLLVPRTEWAGLCQRELDDGIHAFLVEVTACLREVGIGVGMRAHVELERFVTQAAGILEPADALDFGVLQRILPKVRGFKRDLAPGLERLVPLLEARGCRRSLRIVEGWWLDARTSDDDFLDGTDPRLALRHG